ncbi:hypothetical protein T265_02725 [Opisthorchis viverrini]|uniref:Uncharacterized protein n=1 Tax=Opisthorchis viverrini TaxID=6198 RepID=A0A075A5L2_OPIVI|nr:hypothetical protein T265_02725 [Opisthorchis viverrini]KER30910.1 hypothetical protein T265_02725 [Opisthorchis viverrini]
MDESLPRASGCANMMEQITGMAQLTNSVKMRRNTAHREPQADPFTMDGSGTASLLSIRRLATTRKKIEYIKQIRICAKIGNRINRNNGTQDSTSSSCSRLT